MKHIKAFFILSIFSFFAVTTIGQQDSGFTNRAEAKNLMVNGLKEGKWVEYLRRDSTATDTTWYKLSIYKAGMIIGKSRIYYDGEYGKYVAEEIPYINGKINGISKEYYKGGKLKYEIPYTNNKINGVMKGYWETSALAGKYPYTNDEKNGVVKGYYENGRLAGETPFTNGKENGVEKRYDENGKIESETTYTNGVVDTTKNYDKYGNEIK